MKGEETMEQITINISGAGERAQMEKVMRAIHKTLARTEDSCRVSVDSKQVIEKGDLQVPEFVSQRCRCTSETSVSRLMLQGRM